jgi:hypothetical protein
VPAKVHGGVAQQVRARPSQGRGREFEARRHRRAPVVKRRSCRITDPAVGVRVPPGALQARLAQWESARFTPARRQRFDSFAEHGGCSSTRQSAGSWSRRLRVRSASATPRQGRARGSAASCKAVGRSVIGGSSPSPGTHVPVARRSRGTHVPVAQQESAAVSGTAGRPFESGRGRRDARLAGAGGGPQNRLIVRFDSGVRLAARGPTDRTAVP